MVDRLTGRHKDKRLKALRSGKINQTQDKIMNPLEKRKKKKKLQTKKGRSGNSLTRSNGWILTNSSSFF